MGDLLHLDMRVRRRAAELLVFAAAVAGIRIGDGKAQRAAPERGGGIEVIDLAIDDESGESAAVAHGPLPLLHGLSRYCGRARSSSSVFRNRAASPPVAARWSKVSEIGMRRCTSIPPITATTSKLSLPAPMMATVGG